MKARNPSTGNLETVYVKALDSMPVGTIVDYDGQASDIPAGWEAYGQNQLKKTSETRPLSARVLNVNSGSTTDTYSCAYVNNVLKGNILYDGPASDQEITLSESVANYDFLEVYYYGSNGGSTWEMKKIDSPNQKWLGLNYTAHNSGGTFWFYSTRVYIENNKITFSYGGRVYIAGNVVAGQNDTNYISIYKVIGYKY